MCWNAVSDKDLEKKIAKKDIICFKVLQKSIHKYMISIYFNYRYKRMVRQPFISIDEPITSIHNGYHSYKDTKSLFDSILVYPNQRICYFIIPEGTEYYENSNGELVSETIIYKKPMSIIKQHYLNYRYYK